MKRTLIALILMLTFILPSCGGNPEYYDTCMDAFYAVYGDTFHRDSNIYKLEELCSNEEVTKKGGSSEPIEALKERWKVRW